MSRILQGYISNVGEQPTIKVERSVEFNGFWVGVLENWGLAGKLGDES